MAHTRKHSTYSNQEGGERQRREEGGRRRKVKVGRGYKQWSVNGARFRGSPYYSISSACTHLCVAAASSAGEGGGEGGAGRSRHEQRHVRQRPRLHRGQNCTLHSHDSPRLQSRPTAAQDPNCSAVCRAGSLQGKLPPAPWKIPSATSCAARRTTDSDSLFFRLAR